MGLLEKYKSDFIVFVELGFIAANRADEDASVKLFRAAELLDSKNELPKLGLGYIHFLKLELPKACNCFKEALNQNPNSEQAKALLGVAMAMNLDEIEKGKQILREVLNTSKDQSVKDMASTSISFIENDIKTPAPPPPQYGTNKKGDSRAT